MTFIPDKKLRICGLMELHAHLQAWPEAAVLSVQSAGFCDDAAPTMRIRPQLTLSMRDLEAGNQDPNGPTEDHVREGLAFAREQLQDTRLIIHCYLGQSRSTALGLAIMADQMGIGQEVAAVRALYKIRPMAQPNTILMQHADRYLSRDGQLIKALAENTDRAAVLAAQKAFMTATTVEIKPRKPRALRPRVLTPELVRSI